MRTLTQIRLPIAIMIFGLVISGVTAFPWPGDPRSKQHWSPWLAQARQEHRPVLVTFENILSPVTPRHHVVNRTRILEPQRPDNDPHNSQPSRRTQSNYVQMRGLTPFTDPIH